MGLQISSRKKELRTQGLRIVFSVFASAILATACNPDLQLTGESPRNVAITSLDKFSAESGDQIKIEGKNLDSKMKARIDDKAAAITIVSKTEGILTLPSDLSDGLKEVTFTRNSKEIAIIPLIIGEVTDEIPMITALASRICDDTLYKDKTGKLNRGERNCNETIASEEALPACSKTQGAPCSVDGTTYNALKRDSLQANDIRDGITISGVEGTLVPSASECSSDGATSCVTTADFPALDKVNVLQPAAVGLRSSITIAGITGTLADCAVDGGSNCFATANFPAVDKNVTLSLANMAKVMSTLSIAGVGGTMVDCAADGDSGCNIVGPAFVAASTSGAAAKIISGQTLAGIAGAAPTKPADCSVDGQSNCLATANFPALDKVDNLSASNLAKIRNSVTLAGSVGTLGDCSSDGSVGCVAVGPTYRAALTAGAAAKISSGSSVAGITGTAATRPSDCNLDGQTSCVAVSAYPVFDSSAAAPKIVTGQTMGGVAGSAPIRPADCNADGQTSCVSDATYVAADTSSVAAKVISGQTLAGVSGSAVGRPSDCSSDGQTGCVAMNNFPALDKVNALSAGNAAKMLSTLTIAGISGTLAECASDGGAGCVAVGPTYAAALTAGAAAKIMSGQSVAGISGSAVGRPADCSTDGGTDCMAIANFPAVDKLTNLTAGNLAKMHNSVTVAGVSGTMNDCAADGATDCITVAGFPAANTSGAAAKIASGDVLAGVSGTADVRPSDCNSDGATECVAVADFPAVDKINKLSAASAAKIRDTLSIAGVSGTLADCGSDGDAGCFVMGPTYAAALTSGAAAKILSGNTLAGIVGSAAGRPADCAADGATDCVAVTAYPAANSTGAAGKILSGQTLAGISGSGLGRPLDCAVDGATDCVAVTAYPSASSTGAAAKILNGQTLAGISGSAAIKPADCSVDGDTDCVAVSGFPAIDKATKLAGGNIAKIHSSLNIAGVSGSMNDCASDGTLGCLAVGGYPAADATGAAAKILNGQTLAGVSGSAAGKPADCAVDGDINCVTVSGFPAANSTGADAKILSGQTLAGVPGSAAIKPSDCSVDGATDCVAVAAFPAVNKVTNLAAAKLAKIHSSVTVGGVAGTMADCSSDGDTSCLTVAAYPAANSSGAAAKILTGQTLAGISGAAAGRPADCAADGGTNCTAVTNYPAVDKVSNLSAAKLAKIHSTVTVGGIAGTMADCSSDGGTSCLTVTAYPAANSSGATAKILSGQTLAGISGSAAGRPVDCASDGGTNCTAVTNFPAVDKVVNLAAAKLAKIHSSVTVGGVAGAMADCSSDGGTSCLAVSSYPAANSSGAAAKILTGQTLAGVAGSAALRPSDCAADAASGCVSVANYPSIDKAVLTSNAGKVRSGTSIVGVAGSLADCSTDGADGCVVVNPTYAAALVSGAAAKILNGQSVAGIPGSAAVRPSDCAADGGTGCVSTVSYPAANSTGAAAKILSGQTLAAISGTGAGRPSDCATDGDTNCTAVTNFPAVDKANNLSAAKLAKIHSTVTVAAVAGTMASCTSDGEISCMAASGYPAANATGAAAKILTGQTLAGVVGSATLRPSDCAADSGTDCVAVANYPAVDKVNNLAAAKLAKIHTTITLAGVAGTMASCSSDGGINCMAVSSYPAANTTGAAAKILSGQTLAGVVGSAALRPSDCSTDNGTDCVTTSSYPSVNKSVVVAGVIKNGTTIAGVAGNYPSASSPLPGADSTADLTNATFNTKIKMATAFEYWDSTGTRQLGNGDADIAAANIKSGTDIFLTTGTYGAPCTSDAQQNCLVTGNFKAVDSTSFDAWDVRSGKTIAGRAGSIVFQKNLAALSTYNRTSGSGALSSTTTADIYDSLEDYNNNGSFPTQNPGWTSLSSNWKRDPASDTDSSTTCNGLENCVYIDQNTGLYWRKDDGSARTWESAITNCYNMNYGTYTDWRLPTQKEMMQAHIDLMWSMKTQLNIQTGAGTGDYWTATTDSTGTSTAWLVTVFTGYTAGATAKTTALANTCVRP